MNGRLPALRAWLWLPQCSGFTCSAGAESQRMSRIRGVRWFAQISFCTHRARAYPGTACESLPGLRSWSYYCLEQPHLCSCSSSKSVWSWGPLPRTKRQLSTEPSTKADLHRQRAHSAPVLQRPLRQVGGRPRTWLFERAVLEQALRLSVQCPAITEEAYQPLQDALDRLAAQRTHGRGQHCPHRLLMRKAAH